MKRFLTLLLVTFCSLVSISLSGCLLSHSNHTIVRQHEPLKPVTFQSERARATFESQVESRLDNNEASASFGIPFIIGLEKSTKTSENAIRNDVAVMLDVNGDGMVSEYEVSLQR